MMGKRNNTGKAAAAGGAAGIGTAAGAVGAISASGSIAGLSAAGMTSGLAAIGGGSMLAGIAVTALAPIAAAGAIGYGVYKLFED